MTESGRVQAVIHSTLGDEINGDHASPTSVLTLMNAVDFPDVDPVTGQVGGKLSINGDVLEYLSADVDTDTITLTEPYAGAADSGTRVDRWPPKTDVTWEVQVAGTDDSIPCGVRHAIQHLLAEGERGNVDEMESVLIDDSGSEWVVIDVLEQPSRFAAPVDVTTQLTIKAAAGHPAIVIDGEEKRIVLLDESGDEKIILDGETLQIVVNDPAGSPSIVADGVTGKFTAVGQLTTGFPGEPRVVIEDTDENNRSAMLFYTADVDEVTPARIESQLTSTLAGDGFEIVMQGADAGVGVGALLRLLTLLGGETHAEIATDLLTIRAGETHFTQDGEASVLAHDVTGTPTRFNVIASSLAVGDPEVAGWQVIRPGSMIARNADLTDNAPQHIGGSLIDLAVELDVIRVRHAPSIGPSHVQLWFEDSGVGLAWLPAAGVDGELRVSNAVGDGWRPIQASSFDISSDRRLKNKIVDVGDALVAVEAIPVVDFERKDEPGHEQRFFVAQDVAEFLPVAHVAADDEGDKERVSLGGMVATNWRATQQLIEMNREQQQQIDDLKAEVAALRSQEV